MLFEVEKVNLKRSELDFNYKTRIIVFHIVTDFIIKVLKITILESLEDYLLPSKVFCLAICSPFYQEPLS